MYVSSFLFLLLDASCQLTDNTTPHRPPLHRCCLLEFSCTLLCERLSTHEMPFRAITITELPATWRQPLSDAVRLDCATRLGIQPDQLGSTVAFSGPECSDSLEYQRFLASTGSTDVVTICVQNLHDFSVDRQPADVLTWLRHLREFGSPPMWSLVRIFYIDTPNSVAGLIVAPPRSEQSRCL